MTGLYNVKFNPETGYLRSVHDVAGDRRPNVPAHDTSAPTPSGATVTPTQANILRLVVQKKPELVPKLCGLPNSAAVRANFASGFGSVTDGLSGGEAYDWLYAHYC